MSKSLRVGVVGAGAMGADHIDRINNRTSGAHISAIIEPDAARAAAAAEDAPGAQAFTRIEDAIAADAVDAVLIAVPGQFHEPVLVPALEAGLPILCEKPLTPDSESSLRIVELEQKLDKPHIQVGFMRRFDLSTTTCANWWNPAKLANCSCSAACTATQVLVRATPSPC